MRLGYLVQCFAEVPGENRKKRKNTKIVLAILFGGSFIALRGRAASFVLIYICVIILLYMCSSVALRWTVVRDLYKSQRLGFRVYSRGLAKQLQLKN